MVNGNARPTTSSLSSCVRLHEFPFERSMALAPLVDLLSDLPELDVFYAESNLVLADVGAVAEGAEVAQGGSCSSVGAVDLLADFGEADGAALPVPVRGGAGAVVGGQSGAGAAAGDTGSCATAASADAAAGGDAKTM